MYYYVYIYIYILCVYIYLIIYIYILYVYIIVCLCYIIILSIFRVDNGLGSSQEWTKLRFFFEALCWTVTGISPLPYLDCQNP